jgi:hypothetical protein
MHVSENISTFACLCVCVCVCVCVYIDALVSKKTKLPPLDKKLALTTVKGWIVIRERRVIFGVWVIRRERGNFNCARFLQVRTV